ncbi:MAG: hypothetical protein ACI92G_000224 [Candidatus Pelagisphaera sp.]|jgi:hypothetical protein
MRSPAQIINKTSDTHWLSIPLRENEAAVWSAENLTVYAQRVSGDWMLARDESDEARPEQQARTISSVPLGLDWKRWALNKRANEIRFWPSFPDKPLVVKTKIPVILPPKTSVELYVNIPIWLEISVAQDDTLYTLDTVTPTRLSNTWYGTLFEGQLCYAIKSRARRALEDLDDEPLRAACLFKIHNRSEDSLPVDKIRILTEHLSLYQTLERLGTNSVEVNFQGDEHGSELSYESASPEFLKNGQIVREANKPFHRQTLLDKLIFRPLGLDNE